MRIVRSALGLSLAFCLFGCGSPPTVRFGDCSNGVCLPADGDKESELTLPDGDPEPDRESELTLPDGDPEPDKDSELTLPDGDPEPDRESELTLPDGDPEPDKESELTLPDGDPEPEAEPEKESAPPPVRLFCPDTPENWIELYGDTGADSGQALARTKDGSYVLFGHYESRIDFGRSALWFTPPYDYWRGSQQSTFLAFFDAQGINAGAMDSSTGFTYFWGLASYPGTAFPTFGFGAQNHIFLSDWTMVEDDTSNGTIFILDAGGIELSSISLSSGMGWNVPKTLALAENASGQIFALESGDSDALTKYDAQHQVLWRLEFGSRVGYGDSPIGAARSSVPESRFSILPTADGGAVFGGAYKGNLDFGAWTPKSSYGSVDAFMVRVDGQGQVIWAKSFGSPQDDWGLSLAMDDQENIFINLGCTALCDGEFFSTGLTFAKYGPDGTHSNTVGSSQPLSQNRPFPLARDKAGNFFSASNGISRSDSEGLSRAQLDLPVGLIIQDLVPDEEGGVYATGYFKGLANLFCGSLTADGTDAFLMHVSHFEPIEKR